MYASNRWSRRKDLIALSWLPALVSISVKIASKPVFLIDILLFQPNQMMTRMALTTKVL